MSGSALAPFLELAWCLLLFLGQWRVCWAPLLGPISSWRGRGYVLSPSRPVSLTSSCHIWLNVQKHTDTGLPPDIPGQGGNPFTPD